MYAKHEIFLSPDLPHPAPRPRPLGPDPRGVESFFSKPHTPVFKMMSTLLRHITRVTPDPSLAPPPTRGPTSEVRQASSLCCVVWGHAIVPRTGAPDPSGPQGRAGGQGPTIANSSSLSQQQQISGKYRMYIHELGSKMWAPYPQYAEACGGHAPKWDRTRNC